MIVNFQKQFRKSRGVSLVEALISMVILGFLLIMVYKAFVPSMAHFRKANDQTQTEQKALSAYQKLFTELTLSDPASITITSSPTKTISFLSFADLIFTNNGPDITSADLLGYEDEVNKVGAEIFTDSINWKKIVIIYPGSFMAGNKRIYALLKKEVPYLSSPNDTEVHRLTSSAVQDIINDNSYPTYVLCRGIQEANFTMPNYPSVTIEVISAHKSFYKDKEASSRYIFIVTPRN